MIIETLFILFCMIFLGILFIIFGIALIVNKKEYNTKNLSIIYGIFLILMGIIIIIRNLIAFFN